MTTSEHQRRRELRGLSLVEWGTAIGGIFWSVWWSFFVEKLLDSNVAAVDILDFSISKGLFLSFTVVYIGAFVVVMVRWMWSVHKLTSTSSATEWVNSCRVMVVMVVALAAGISWVSEAFSLSRIHANYGIGLTIVWPLAILILIYGAKQT